MGLLLLIGGIYFLGLVIDTLKEKNNHYSNATTSNTKSYDLSSLRTPSSDSYTKSKETSVVNNYYVQQNIYVQQNYQHHKSSKTNKDHSEKVWNELGYSVKRGETYAYKFYGNEIYTPDQVVKSSSNRVKYSEDGLATKLLNNTGSKKMAKDILVREYGYNESNAKALVGYRGY